MLVKTTRFGEVEVQEDQIINFPLGIPGFEEEKDFVLISLDPDNPVRFLQSITEPELTFILVPPRNFFPDYELHVSDDVLTLLEVEKEEEMDLYVILTVPQDLKMTTANLLAPIIINPNLRRGVQAIPPQSPYITRHLLFAEGAKQAQAR